jgi:DNA-binding response OmpR family regulator
MRCLVIEDEAATARYITNGLKEAGFTVVWSRDGVDGLHLAAGERWDVLNRSGTTILIRRPT